MLKKSLILAALLVCVSLTFTFAQTASLDTEAQSTLIALNTVENDVFFTDPDTKVCYIDFAALNGYAKELIVKSGSDVVYRESVWELPENTIYELDYDEYLEGKYEINLHTYSTVVRKVLDVN